MNHLDSTALDIGVESSHFPRVSAFNSQYSQDEDQSESESHPDFTPPAKQSPRILWENIKDSLRMNANAISDPKSAAGRTVSRRNSIRNIFTFLRARNRSSNEHSDSVSTPKSRQLTSASSSKSGSFDLGMADYLTGSSPLPNIEQVKTVSTE